MFCLIRTAKLLASWCCHLQAQRRALGGKNRSLVLTKAELLLCAVGKNTPHATRH